MLTDLLYRLRAVLRRNTVEHELDNELRFHFDRQVEKYVASGLDRAEAVRQARLKAGGLEQLKEECREARGTFTLETVIRDLGYALRMWRKNPLFAMAAITAIGLGIGVNAAVFTLVNAVLYKTVGFDGKGRLIYVEGFKAGCEWPCDTGRSYPDFHDFRSQAKSFDELVAYCFRPASVSDKRGFPESYRAMHLSANAFPVLGWKPAAGRNLIPADELPGAAPVAMLTYGLWEARYGKDPSIIGKAIRINEEPTVVVGVMPREAQIPITPDLLMPLVPAGEWEKRENHGLLMFGRLAKSATLISARAEMDSISRRLENEYPLTDKGISVRVWKAKDYFFPRIRMVFLALWIAVGFVLLVACANVANLLLARAVSRSREISIRVSLGAGRWRVMRQLLVESVTLSVAGGLLGLLLAIWGVRAFDLAIAGTGKPAWLDFSMDYAVFAYLAAISIAAGILFGLAPAVRLSRLDVITAIKDGGHGASGGSRGGHLAGLLVVSEMAFTVMLLVGASLMIRLFLNTYRAQIGVNTAGVLSMRLDLPEKKYSRPIDQVSFYQRLLARLQALPGVETASITSSLPGHGAESFTYELEGAPPVDPRRRPHVRGLLIGPSYFQAMNIRPLLGRAFTESDGMTAVPVVIVNHTFAARFWPGEGNPLAKRLRLFTDGAPQSWLSIVGVVPDVAQNERIRNQFDPLIYLPYRRQPQQSMSIVARARVPPATLGNAFRRQVQALDENLPVYALRTLDEDLDLRDWPIRVFGAMFTGFAAIALLLASVGLYAVVAQAVNQRTQEIGVRLAMGATGANIIRLVFAQGMRQVTLGLALGLAAAFGLTRVLRSLLAGVLQPDAVLFLTVALVLIAAATLACAIPARRATRVDPVVALRCE
jgi:putative ABC transport system permease protein